MYLIRLLILCLATLAMAAQPSRAAPVCPMHMHPVQAAAQADNCGHADGPRHHHTCPGAMACCTPMAVRATPASLVQHIWLALPRARPAPERDRDDAARDGLLRPPTSA